MGRYIVMRLLSALLVIFGVLVVVSFILRFIPGDPIDVIAAGNPGITEEQKEELRSQLGLSDPVHVQFVKYAGGVVRGDLGESLRFRTSARTLVLERLPATFELTILSMVLAILFALPLGIITALTKDSPIDFLGSTLALTGISTPNFLLGILLVMLFSVELGWLPSGTRGEPLLGAFYQGITGQGFGPLLDSLEHIALPAVALGLSVATANVRTVRSAMIEVLQTDYVRFAKAKGLPPRMVFLKHSLRNALIPTVTVIGLQVGYLLSGSFVIENVFAWPGIGRLAVQSIFWRDYPLIQAIVLVSSTIFVLVNVVVDITYHYIDPRIRLR